MNIYESLRRQLLDMIETNQWQDELIDIVYTRPLSAIEAIGRPERDDYPILVGREVILETEFKGAKGQAFTDQPGSFSGTLQDVVNLPLNSNYQRAVFIATLNAVLRYMGKIGNTVHCKDDAPERCSRALVSYVKEHYGQPKIAFIGYQPALISALAREYELRATDLNPDNIGKSNLGVLIEPAAKTEEVLDWADIIVATGSTIVNSSIVKYLDTKPVLFYGITVAGAACLNDWQTFCPYSK
jgi:hypothetical protein